VNVDSMPLKVYTQKSPVHVQMCIETIMYTHMYTKKSSTRSNVYRKESTTHICIPKSLVHIQMCIEKSPVHTYVHKKALCTFKCVYGCCECVQGAFECVHGFFEYRLGPLRPATATHCNTLQHTATHRNTLQHTATRYTDRDC